MSADVYIYALTDDRGIPRYVGQSVDPWKRRTNHVSRHAAAAVLEWIENLASVGKQPTLIVLYKVQPDEDAGECERRFIRLLATTSELLNWRPGARVRRRAPEPTAGSVLLAAYANERGLSQKALAAMIGVDQPRMSRMLSGQRRPGRRSAVALLETCGIPLAAWEQAP